MRTVLVVDDEWAIAQVLDAVLGDEGYRVVVATDGRRGLERAREARPDAVLLDFMMPVMDGPALIGALREDPSLAGIPVILMSSMPEAAVRERCPGIAAFLRKPFRIAQVLRVLEGVVGPGA